MFLLAILSYHRLFHLKLFLFIINYLKLNYFWQSETILIYGYRLFFILVINGY